MTITVSLRKMLHRKVPEFCTPAPASTAAGSFLVSDKCDAIPGHDTAYFVLGTSSIWNYSADDDAWMQLPNSGIAGAFAAGACGEFRAIAAPGGTINLTATGGSATTIVTNLTITRDLAGCEVLAIGGAGSGYYGSVKSNTKGANSVLTLNMPSGTAFAAGTTFRLYSGSLWFFNAGTSGVGFAVYDRATNAWAQRSVTGLPTAFGTDGQLISTPGRTSNRGAGFVNGTTTSATSATLADGAKTWPVDAWKNFQVRIVSGAGAGQIRAILSNSANTLTVAAWTTTPNATSVYRIEGNDDYLYLMGNGAVTLYRYSITGNTWSTLAPGTARVGSPGAGCTMDWIDSVQRNDWQDASCGAHYATSIVRQLGRYLYSFRGGAVSYLDVYDIAANTWINGVAYGNQQDTFTTGSCAVDIDGVIYLQKDNTGRIYQFDVAEHCLKPFTFNPVPQGAAVAGDKMFITTLVDSETRINYLYTLGNARAELTRWLII